MEGLVKLPTTLIKALLRQAALDLDLSVERDIEVIRRRIEHEGLSFITITLPKLSDSLEKGLESGLLICPDGFTRHRSLPRLLGGFFRRVFEKDGRLLPHPCVESIAWIRQICRFFKKLKIPCSKRRETDAIRHFVEVEGELRRGTFQVERQDYVLDSIAGIIWSQVFPEPDYNNLVCHHGPGVTADRRLSNERHRICWWNTRSEHSFPSDLHCYPNYGEAAAAGISGGWIRNNEERAPSEVPGIVHLSVKDEVPVRVVFVPKTQTAPRVIAIEPSHMQFMQQSVKDMMYDVLEKHRLTRRSVRFTDQSVNQSLAYQSSISKRLSTLDLKDASDRVHLHLVQRIFKNSGILELLEDSRSLSATLPNDQNLVLWKFASMGSALCFPVEACVFYTLIQSAMHMVDGRRPCSRSIENYSRKIAVYGDDIIIPVEYTDFVVQYLESYLLKVNVSKSFKEGNFRESCGADYFNGVDVKPVYARQVPHDVARDWTAETVMSWNATADLFYLKGKWHVAQVIRDMLASVVKRRIPRARSAGSGVFHLSLLFDTNLRWNVDLCGYKQRRIHYQPLKRKDSINDDGIACLNKWGQSQSRKGHSSWFSSLHRRTDSSRGSHLEGGLVHSIQASTEVCPGRSGFGFPDAGEGTVGRTLEELPGGLPSELPIGRAEGTVHQGPRPVSDLLSLLKYRERELDLLNCAGDYRPDPLGHLTGDITGLDFDTSVNRGRFKSKCRWTSLTS